MLTASPFNGDTILPLADARVQANLTADDDHHDAAIESARDAAISWVEAYTGHSLQEREFVWKVDQFKSVMALPVGPVIAAVVEYYDGDGVDTEIDAADAYLTADHLVPAVNSVWPYADGRPGGVRLTLTAGYETAADIPPNLMQAVKLAMTAFFENRSNPDLAGAIRLADQNRRGWL